MKDKSLASLDNQVIILKGCSVNLYLEPRGGKNFVLRSEVRVQALVIEPCTAATPGRWPGSRVQSRNLPGSRCLVVLARWQSQPI